MSAAAAAAPASSPSAAAALDEKSSRHPPWHGPHGASDLRVLNSLTSNKVPLVPAKDRFLGWYTCGPTVYDSAHLGHARCYVTFDIIRRILTDYFKYNVFYVMNITDVDDKIIIRSRRNFLVDQYSKSAVNGEAVKKDIGDAFDQAVQAQQGKVEKAAQALKDATEKNKYVDDSRTAHEEEIAKLDVLVGEHKAYQTLAGSSSPAPPTVAALIAAGKGPLSESLDRQHGASVVDHSIFKAHASFYEAEFLEDMRSLGVRDVDAVTRVTEYVDHIIRYVEGIVANGYGYEAGGSVYFDTARFQADGFHYAKLTPWAVGNVQLSQSGEGALTTDSLGRKSNQDFALWKTSKKGEPAWDSPWGKGRPGWHIECSAMASDLLGTTFDVHSGGTDLKFPHHDNEIAQSESHAKCKQWVNHFWHAGHLNIAGLKMSKSLKNFITIRDVLRKYSGRQVRFLFLLTPWETTMNFSDDSLRAACSKEKDFNEFFANTAIAVRARPTVSGRAQLWNAEDRRLHARLVEVRQAVHEALCDNFDYPRVMGLLSDLIGETNKYRAAPSGEYKTLLLTQITRYVDSMMRVFGVIPDPEPGFAASGGDVEGSKKLAGVLDAVAAFRDSMRDAARAKKSPQEVLALCDAFRDEAMVELGVRMEDVTVAASAASSASSSSDAASSPAASPPASSSSSIRSVWKLADPQDLKRERDEKRREESSARLAKTRNKLDKLGKDLAKLQEFASPPTREFFAAQKDKFSLFDAEGKPTHDAAGVELTKSALKSLAKNWDVREKGHRDAQAKLEKNPKLIEQMQQEQAELQAEVKRLEEQQAAQAKTAQ